MIIAVLKIIFLCSLNNDGNTITCDNNDDDARMIAISDCKSLSKSYSCIINQRSLDEIREIYKIINHLILQQKYFFDPFSNDYIKYLDIFISLHR